MQCPECYYVLSDFDLECPRCHGKGMGRPESPSPAPSPLSINHGQCDTCGAPAPVTATKCAQCLTTLPWARRTYSSGQNPLPPAPQSNAPATRPPSNVPPPVPQQVVYPQQVLLPQGYPPQGYQPQGYQQLILVQTNVRGGGFMSGLGSGAGAGLGCCCLASFSCSCSCSSHFWLQSVNKTAPLTPHRLRPLKESS